MNNLSDIAVVKDILKRHQFRFSKSMGQNFLINPSVCPMMAEHAVIDDHTAVIEIGPGIGVLTRELAKRARKVVSIELDARLIPVLAETLDGLYNVTVINDDILKIDLPGLIERELGGMRVVVCANLPYYITSPIVMHLLESRLPVDSITVMIQKEAAERLCAEPGTRAVGAVSIATQYYAQPSILFDVDRGSFMPPPSVESTVIGLAVRKSPPVEVESEKQFFAVVKAAFGQRRKTILNAVAAGMSIPKEKVAECLDRVGIAQNMRAEQLSMAQFAAVSNALS